MKKIFSYFMILVMAGFMSFNLTSCGGDDPAPIPTVQIQATVDGYDVIIAVNATDATSLEWSYGDGNTENTSGTITTHDYTYDVSGPYTITVKAVGDGGEAQTTANVTIAASIEEIIAGGDDNGKTWVLTQAETSYTGKMGVGTVTNDMALIPEMSILPNNMLGLFGLGDEYSDEFTFYRNGTFKVDVKNNQALAGYVYGAATQTMQVPSSDPGSLPLCAISYQNVTDGTWALDYVDFTVNAYNEFKDPKVMEDVTYTFPEDDPNKIARLNLSAGSYLGFVDLDYRGVPGLDTDNSFYILKEVTTDYMVIAIGMNGVDNVDGQPTVHKPTMTIHMALEPK